MLKIEESIETVGQQKPTAKKKIKKWRMTWLLILRYLRIWTHQNESLLRFQIFDAFNVDRFSLLEFGQLVSNFLEVRQFFDQIVALAFDVAQHHLKSDSRNFKKNLKKTYLINLSLENEETSTRTVTVHLKSQKY